MHESVIIFCGNIFYYIKHLVLLNTVHLTHALKTNDQLLRGIILALRIREWDVREACYQMMIVKWFTWAYYKLYWLSVRKITICFISWTAFIPLLIDPVQPSASLLWSTCVSGWVPDGAHLPQDFVSRKTVIQSGRQALHFNSCL